MELIGSQLVYFAKNNFNRTNVVDDVNGDLLIANSFKDKYERLFNSVQCSKEESELSKTQIASEVVSVCNTTKTCESSDCVQCHLNRTDVSTAVSKLKTDKVYDNGMIYSNNFIHGTELIFQYLGLLYTSMVYHGYCPPSFICANIIPIPKGSKANLSDSDKYRSIAISGLLGNILDHIIIEKQSEALKTSNYHFGFKAKSSTVHVAPWCMKQYSIILKFVINLYMHYYLMPPRHLTKWHLMCYSINYVIRIRIRIRNFIQHNMCYNNQY